MPSPWFLCLSFETSTYIFHITVMVFRLSNKTELWPPQHQGSSLHCFDEFELRRMQRWLQKRDRDDEVDCSWGRWRPELEWEPYNLNSSDIFALDCHHPLQFPYLSFQFWNPLIFVAVLVHWPSGTQLVSNPLYFGVPNARRSMIY